jgi:hypothetical protein
VHRRDQDAAAKEYGNINKSKIWAKDKLWREEQNESVVPSIVSASAVMQKDNNGNNNTTSSSSSSSSKKDNGISSIGNINSENVNKKQRERGIEIVNERIVQSEKKTQEIEEEEGNESENGAARMVRKEARIKRERKRLRTESENDRMTNIEENEEEEKGDEREETEDIAARILRKEERRKKRERKRLRAEERLDS